MPGTPSGSVDHLQATTTAQLQNQEYFTHLFRFFNGPLLSGGYVELVALNTGSSAGAITAGGTNLHDEPGSFGECAMVVWRVKSGSATSASDSFPSVRRSQDYYVLFQWSDTLFITGNVATSPALIQSASNVDGVGCAIAFCDDGTNPWNGTMFGNGNDNKGSPVWITGSSPTGRLHVLPRSNCAGGVNYLLRENLTCMHDVGASAVANRYHFIHDRDTFYSVRDQDNDGTYTDVYIHGTYEPLQEYVTSSGGIMGDLTPEGFATAHMPMLQIGGYLAASITIAAATDHGVVSGSGSRNGGIVCPVMSQSIMHATAKTLRLGRTHNTILVTAQQPNRQFSVPAHQAFPLAVYVDEQPDFGFCGHLDFLLETFTNGANNISSGSTYAAINTSLGAISNVVPWRGAAPGGSFGRAGRQF